MLATIVALLIVPLTMTRLSPGRLAVPIAMLCLSGALAMAYVPDTIVERLATTATEVEDQALRGRFKLWKAGLSAFAAEARFRATAPPASSPRSARSWVSYARWRTTLSSPCWWSRGWSGCRSTRLCSLPCSAAVRRPPPLERRFGLVLLATLVRDDAPAHLGGPQGCLVRFGGAPWGSPRPRSPGPRTARAVPHPGRRRSRRVCPGASAAAHGAPARDAIGTPRV